MTGPSDVATTLNDLERKLRDLERELATASDPAPAASPSAPGPSPAAAPAPPSSVTAPVPPAPTTAAYPSVAPYAGPGDDAHRDVLIPAPSAPASPAPGAAAPSATGPSSRVAYAPAADLHRFRAQLAEHASELIGAFDRLVGPLPGPAEIAAAAWNTAPAAAPPQAPTAADAPAPATPAPPSPSAWTPSPAPAPAWDAPQTTAAPAPGGWDPIQSGASTARAWESSSPVTPPAPHAWDAPAPASPAPHAWDAPAPAPPAPHTWDAPAPASPAPHTPESPAPAGGPDPVWGTAPDPLHRDPAGPPSAFLPLPDAPVLPSPSSSGPGPATYAPGPLPVPDAPAPDPYRHAGHAPDPAAPDLGATLPGPPAGAFPTPVTSALPTPVTDVLPPAGPGPNDQLTFSGQVTVDAGPFEDIATLSSFEQALGHVPGTQDVYVRGFEGSRALIDVVLGQPVALGDELRRNAPMGFTITAATSDHLSITIDGGWHA